MRSRCTARGSRLVAGRPIRNQVCKHTSAMKAAAMPGGSSTAAGSIHTEFMFIVEDLVFSNRRRFSTRLVNSR